MAAPGPVLYLDVDDEITSAAARIRNASEGRVALGVPPGSRIATSRINFRLLARDATLHGRDLAIIAPDPGSRSLAAAAGLEVFASVADYEASTGGPTSGADGDRARTEAALAAAALAGATGGRVVSETIVEPPATAPAAPAALPPARAAPRPATAAPQPAATPDELRPRSAAAASTSAGVAGSRRGAFGGRGLAIVVGTLLVGGVVVALVGGYLLLPSATIVVTPREESLGPVSVTVTADPEATTVDVANGVVPAQRVTFEVAAEGTYEATGARVVETQATGTVRWQNCDPTASYTIPAGTVVRTSEDIRFTTVEEVFLPVAVLTPPTISCQTRDVGIEAVEAGPASNVAADTITVIPGSLNSIVISVTNRAATSGGSRESFPRVVQADVDRAVADLEAKLDAAFAAELAAPDAVGPGLTLFAETASLGEPTYDPDPAGFVGAEIPSFQLTASAAGTAIAVDESPVGQVAEAQLVESLEPGYVLVDGSIESTVGAPTISGETVTFPASATAAQVQVLDPAELEELILGLTPAEAEAALDPYGETDIALWPDWASTIPTFAFRVELTVDGPTEEGSPTPTSTGSPPASGPSGTPAASGPPSGPPSTAPTVGPSPSVSATPSAAPSP